MRKELKIGLAGILALLILFFGINYLKGINMLRIERYYLVDFNDINGLAVSSPVFANGLQVGIVHDIKYDYDRPGHVIVGIQMEENMRIPEGSYGEIVTEMLGTVKMNVIFNLDTNVFIEEGDTIEGHANPGIMDAAGKELMPAISAMLPKMDSILASLNALLADPALRNTLQNTERLTANLTQTTDQLGKLMSNEVPQLASNMTALSENMLAISDNLKGVDYAATISRVDATLDNVKALTDKLNSKDNSIGLLMNDPSFYNNLNQTAANTASLLQDFKEHPKRYVHFSLFGKKDKAVTAE